MPTAFGDAPSSLTEYGLPRAILTLPEAGGTFAVAMDWYNEDLRSLWFRPFGGEWALVATGPDLNRLAPGLRFPGPFHDADVSKDGKTVRFFSGHWKDASVFLRKGPDGWMLDEAAAFQGWEEHPGSGVRLAWIGEGRQDLTEPYLWFLEQPVVPMPPALHVLDPGTLAPRPIAGVSARGTVVGDSIFYSAGILDLPGLDPLLVETETGWVAFDGSTFTALPALGKDRIGDHAGISGVGPLVLIQSAQGVFRVTEDLGAERIENFPGRLPSTTIAFLEDAQLFVVAGVADRAVYTSRDFVRFEKVPSPSPIKSAVAALPDRQGMLLVGPDGLYTLEAECPAGD